MLETVYTPTSEPVPIPIRELFPVASFRRSSAFGDLLCRRRRRRHSDLSRHVCA